MSADRYSACPRCRHNLEQQPKDLQETAALTYGKADQKRYDEVREQLLVANAALSSMRETFREDWELYGTQSGTLTVQYHGECSVCGLKLEFTDKKVFFTPDYKLINRETHG